MPTALEGIHQLIENARHQIEIGNTIEEAMAALYAKMYRPMLENQLVTEVFTMLSNLLIASKIPGHDVADPTCLAEWDRIAARLE